MLLTRIFKYYKILNLHQTKEWWVWIMTYSMLCKYKGTQYRAVFLSTVRTCHLAESVPRIPSNTPECDGDFGDFGFLSDQKLLNTAMTRARSMVAVVGDPVALCAIGESMSIWRVYLKHCQNLRSIHPATMTLDNIRSQVHPILLI